MSADSLSFPEVEASELSPEILCRALQSHNCLLVRRIAPPALMKGLEDRAIQIFEMRQQQLERQELPPAYSAHAHDKKDLLNCLMVSDLDMPNGPQLQVLAMLRASLLKPLLHSLLGPQVYMNVSQSAVRKALPERSDTFLPYHQDGQFHVHHQLPYLNCWIPLGPCGKDAPSLEVLTADMKEILHPADNSPDRPADSDGLLDTEAFLAAKTYVHNHSEQIWHPEFAAGDLLLLNEYTIHRTYHHAMMSQPRYSLELRFNGAEQLPAELNEKFIYRPM